jgi:transposase
MNKFNHFVGIDISKKTFDAALIIYSNTATIKHQIFQQDAAGFTNFIDWLAYYKVAVQYIKKVGQPCGKPYLLTVRDVV